MSEVKYAVEVAALQATANVGGMGSQPLLQAKSGIKMALTAMGLFWEFGGEKGMVPLTNIRGVVFKKEVVPVEDKPAKKVKEQHA